METNELSWIQSKASPSMKEVRLQLGLSTRSEVPPRAQGVGRPPCQLSCLQTCPVRPAAPPKIMGLAFRGKHFGCHHNGSSVPHKLCYWKEREGSNTKSWRPGNGTTSFRHAGNWVPCRYRHVSGEAMHQASATTGPISSSEDLYQDKKRLPDSLCSLPGVRAYFFNPLWLHNLLFKKTQ